MNRHVLFNSKEFLLSHVREMEVIPGSQTRNLEKPNSNKVAFITGGTGFIGGYLLLEMLQQEDYHQIFCLVRKNTNQSISLKLLESLQAKGFEKNALPEKITLLQGDVMEERLGLSAEDFTIVESEATDVFHFAAVMNWVAPFNQTTLASLEALKQCIRLCSTRQLKKLHYASSMGIWTLLEQPTEPLDENAIPAFPDQLPGGYFQSKWISEILCQDAMNQGVPVNIYRLGDVKGNSDTGYGDSNNLGNIIMKYFIKHQVVLDHDVSFNYLPVDYLVKAIYHISLSDNQGTYQFSNSERCSFRDMYNCLVENGNNIQLLGMKEWCEKLKSDQCDLAVRLRPVFKPFSPDSYSEKTTLFELGTAMFGNKHLSDHTERALEGSGITCPKMLSDGVLNRYLLHLENSIELVGE